MPLTHRPSTGWQGLVDPDTGRLLAKVPLDALIVAGRVELDQGVLRFDWRFSPERDGFELVKPPSTLLERFLGFRTDQGILSLARRFGPLGLSGEGDEAVADPQPFRIGRGEQRESLTAWRRYQGEFNALLTLAAALRERESPKAELFEEVEALTAGGEPQMTPMSLWELASFTAPGSRRRSPRQRPSFYFYDNFSTASVTERLAMTAELLRTRTNRFIQWCGLRPALTFESTAWPSRPTLAFQDTTANSCSFGLSLFGALAVQLLAAATGAGFAVCSACGSVFVPRRRHPAFGKRRYCRACGRKEALKAAKADYRAKLRRLGVRKLDAGASKRHRRRT